MRDFFRYFDKTTFIVLLLLCFFGLIMIYSASYNSDDPHFSKQLLFLAVSLGAFIIVFRVKTETLFNTSMISYLSLLGFLVLLLLTGRIIAGVKSWVRIGMFSFQASEFIKIPTALFLARILTRISIIDWPAFFKIAAILGCPFFLIAMQPDLGTAFMLLAFFLTAIVLKKIKPAIIIFLILTIGAGSFAAWSFVLKDYQKARIISFLNPEKFQKSSGYQIIQSKIAIGSGGLTGKGYMNGTQSQYQFLPTRHTDFIVPVLGEELGFLGISILLMLFFTLFYRQFNLKTESDEEFYFVYLFNGLIFFQFLINILMTSGFFPVIGVPLPFFSYGGSSLLSFFIGEAIIFRIKINNYIGEYSN